jgi:hypothetical protein
MDILIEEAPQLIISLCLIIASVVLIVMRVASVVEGMPLLILVAAYWVGNGSARLASQQTLTNPANAMTTAPMGAISVPKPLILGGTGPSTVFNTPPVTANNVAPMPIVPPSVPPTVG